MHGYRLSHNCHHLPKILLPMAITNAHLTESIRKKLGLLRNQSRVLIETLLEIIKQTLAVVEDLVISRFGKFRVREKMRVRAATWQP